MSSLPGPVVVVEVLGVVVMVGGGGGGGGAKAESWGRLVVVVFGVVVREMGTVGRVLRAAVEASSAL